MSDKYICMECYKQNGGDVSLICRAVVPDGISPPNGCLYSEDFENPMPKWEEEKNEPQSSNQ